MLTCTSGIVWRGVSVRMEIQQAPDDAWSESTTQQDENGALAEELLYQRIRYACIIGLGCGLTVFVCAMCLGLLRHRTRGRRAGKSLAGSSGQRKGGSESYSTVGQFALDLSDLEQESLDEQWTDETNKTVETAWKIWDHPVQSADANPSGKDDPASQVVGAGLTADRRQVLRPSDGTGDVQPTEPEQTSVEKQPDSSNSVGSENLVRLTEEVAALRQYAASQQDRVRRLQDGYDWGILKNFCLRIIRCIDNLDSRIDKLNMQHQDTVNLEEIRDELLFALESGGVEQFKPDIYSQYDGCQRNLEVLSERVVCEDPQLADKIADVVRCGYRYVISDDDVKIVRTAQVRLFEPKMAELLAR